MPAFANVRTGTPAMRQLSKETPLSRENCLMTERNRASSSRNLSSSVKLFSCFSRSAFSWMRRTFSTPVEDAITFVSSEIRFFRSSESGLCAPRPLYLCVSSAFMYASTHRERSRPSAMAFLFSSDIPLTSRRLPSAKSDSLIYIFSGHGRRAFHIDSNKGRAMGQREFRRGANLAPSNNEYCPTQLPERNSP